MLYVCKIHLPSSLNVLWQVYVNFCYEKLKIKNPTSHGKRKWHCLWSKVRGRNLLFRKPDTRTDFLSRFASSVEPLDALIWTTDCLVCRMLFESLNLCLKSTYKRGPLTALSCRIAIRLHKITRQAMKSWAYFSLFFLCVTFSQKYKDICLLFQWTCCEFWTIFQNGYQNDTFLELTTESHDSICITVRFIFCILLWACSPKGMKETLILVTVKTTPIFKPPHCVPKCLAIKNCKVL